MFKLGLFISDNGEEIYIKVWLPHDHPTYWGIQSRKLILRLLHMDRQVVYRQRSAEYIIHDDNEDSFDTVKVPIYKGCDDNV